MNKRVAGTAGRFIKNIVMAAVLLVTVLTWALDPVDARADLADGNHRVFDGAGILSPSEAESLDHGYIALTSEHDFDLVFITENDPNLYSAMDRADDLFDYNGFGKGSNRSGALLYINMATRDYWISTRGYGITAFTDAAIDYAKDTIQPLLRDGQYYSAAVSFLELSEDFLNRAEAGAPYKGEFSPVKVIGISAIAGLIAALIYTLILKGELKSVAPKNQAADYVVPGSLNVTRANEFFLYRTVSKTRKESSSSGSHTHTSSSGASHGGGGGKF